MPCPTQHADTVDRLPPAARRYAAPLVISTSRVGLKQQQPNGVKQDKLSGWGGSLQWRSGPKDVMVSKVQVNSQGKVSLGLKLQSGTKEWLGGVMVVPLVMAVLEWAGWSR